MENASKALLMAGGILIAMLIIGALVLMFNQVGTYGKAQEASKKNSQIADFNKDFERYLDDKGITGTDVISIINKVIDYNNKAKSGGVEKSVNYDVKLSVTISNLDSFNSQYAYEKIDYKMFKNDSYTVGDDYDKLTNKLLNDLKSVSDAEDIVKSNDLLKQISGMYNEDKQDLKVKQKSIEKIREKLVELKGSDYEGWPTNGKAPTLDTIKKYRQYWEFKTSKFKPVESATKYNNGQIEHMEFKFEK